MDNSMHEKLLVSSEGKEVVDFKTKVCDESRKIWRIALPGMLARVASFGTMIVTQSFIGHQSSIALAAYALVRTLTVRFVNGILIGMSSATETLCGQSYGARQYHMMSAKIVGRGFCNFHSSSSVLPCLNYSVKKKPSQMLQDTSRGGLQFCVHFDDANVSTSTAKEQHRCVDIDRSAHIALALVVVICLCLALGGGWSNGSIVHIFLVCCICRIRLHYRWLVPSYVDWIQHISVYRYLACHKALNIVWDYGLS